MNKKIIISIFIILLISISSLSLIQNVLAKDYMEIEDEFYSDEGSNNQNEDILNYYNNVLPNQVTINFHEDASYGIDVHIEGNHYDLADPLSECIVNQSHNTSANITTLKRELTKICKDYGLSNPNITITSPYGDDMFITSVVGDGISMEPTLYDGAILILNKTHDVHVGDIVVANTSEYGVLGKRIAEIDGDKIFLVSDNVNGTYENNRKTYSYEGVRTWANISDIDGVGINVLNNGGVIRV